MCEGRLQCRHDVGLPGAAMQEGAPDAAYENEHGRYYDFDWDRVDDFLDGIDFSDPGRAAQAWVIVLATMMMDYRYLYLH